MSRSSPALPDDVPGDHPLWTITARPLASSQHARDVELAAKYELSRLLGGSDFQRDVLGLITASGGGLSAGDLERLTGRPRFEVDRLLSGHFGRSTSVRTPRDDPEEGPPRAAERTYGLSHATLRELAQEQFGRTLTDYHQRLHEWADDYHAQNWPANTPQYLLHGYSRMLIENEDVVRLATLVVNESRHDRMLEATGGDAEALAEVDAATAVASSQPVPDLAALFMFAVTREELRERNARLPAELPALWVAAGFPERALALTNGIVDVRARARAATLMITAAAAASNQAFAQRSATVAEQSVRAIPQSAWRASALAQLIRALSAIGRHERALELLGEVPDLTLVADVFPDLLPALVAAGDLERADVVMADAERRTARIVDVAARVEVTARLATALDAAGHPDKARALLRTARRTVRDIEEPGRRAQALCRLVESTASVRDFTRAEKLSREIDDPGWQGQAITGLVGSATAAGDFDHARRLVDAITDTRWKQEAQASLAAAKQPEHHSISEITDTNRQAQAMLGMMQARADIGDSAGAVQIADTVERLARTTPDDDSRAETLADLTALMGRLGTPAAVERAIELAREIPNPASRLQALTGLAKQLTVTGDLTGAAALAREAEQLARQTPDLWRTHALIGLAAALGEIGDNTQSLRLAKYAERSAATIDDRGWRAKLCTELIGPVAAAGDPESALRIATTAEQAARGTPNRVQALTQLVAPIATAGDRHRARQLAAEVQQLALNIPNEGWRAQALTQLVDALISIGDVNRALEIAQKITVDEWRAQALWESALKLTQEHRDIQAAVADEHKPILRRIAADILRTPSWIRALTIVAKLDPAALQPLAAALCRPWQDASETPDTTGT